VRSVSVMFDLLTSETPTTLTVTAASASETAAKSPSPMEPEGHGDMDTAELDDSTSMRPGYTPAL